MGQSTNPYNTFKIVPVDQDFLTEALLCKRATTSVTGIVTLYSTPPVTNIEANLEQSRGLLLPIPSLLYL